jgi:hypothetical protein
MEIEPEKVSDATTTSAPTRLAAAMKSAVR